MLDKALMVDAEVLLMQDAVLFTNSAIEANNKLLDHKIYALESDVEKRGIKNKLLQHVELLNVDALVDLLFSGKTILNL
jgi:sulfur relay protein TusB/DsrH